jgi:hypothetical protein
MTAHYPLALYGTSIQEVQPGDTLDANALPTVPTTLGGTGNAFTKFSGPATSEKTFTLPNSSETLLYSGGALGTPASGTLTNCTGLPQAGLATNVAATGPLFLCTQAGTSVTSSWTKLTSWSETYDIGAFFDSATNSRYQPTVAGYYYIVGFMQINGTTSGISSGIYKNGSAHIGGLYFTTTNQANPSTISEGIVHLNGSTDYIEFYGYSLTTLNTAAARFSGCLIRSE